MAELLEGRAKVDVLRDARDLVMRHDMRPRYDERHADVRLERRHLPRHQPVIAHVVAVVRAEDDVRVAGDAVAGQRRLELRDQVVDRLDRLRPFAVRRVDLRSLRRRQERMVAQPGRLVRDVVLVEGRRARCLQPGEVGGVPRRRRVRPVRRERRDLEEERLALAGGVVDERGALAREHVGQIGARTRPVVDQLPVLVEVVVELGIAVAGDVPFVPAGWDVALLAVDETLRLVAVQVLAHHRGLVAARLELGREGGVLLALRVEDRKAAVVAAVGEDPGVVRVAAREGGRSRRAAE